MIFFNLFVFVNPFPRNGQYITLIIWVCLIGREREMFYLTMHLTHFIYGYMASDIWLRTILIVRKETRCRHIGYSYRLTARFFYMHHPTDRITHTTAFLTPVVEHLLEREIAHWVHPMKDRSDDPSHHERTLYLWATSCSLVSLVCTNIPPPQPKAVKLTHQ